MKRQRRRANDHPISSTDPDKPFPGEDSVELSSVIVPPSTVLVGVDPNLNNIGFDDDMEGATFVPGTPDLPGCDDYYNAELAYQWDLDGEGTVDTTEPNPQFPPVIPAFADGLDGPDFFPIAVGPSHPATRALTRLSSGRTWPL